jgi:hypothetical protein
MPTLIGEENPPQLSVAYARLAEIPGEWFVVQTRGRSEKAAAFAMMALGVPHYLPMRSRRTRAARRDVDSMRVVFPGYVFGCGDAGQRYDVWHSFETRGLVSVVHEVRLQKRLLTHLEKLMADIEAQPSEASPWSDGDRFRATRGKWEGCNGVIEIGPEGEIRKLLRTMGDLREVDGAELPDEMLEAA